MTETGSTELQRQALGLDESHLADFAEGVRVHCGLIGPLRKLGEQLRPFGCELSVASGYRSFERQLSIFNAKAGGRRPVLDDCDRPVELAALSDREKLFAILRFSALPGTSRHHWGTDVDVYDSAAGPSHYRVQLTASECVEGGVFGTLHRALDRVLSGRGDFYRPYAEDTGGVAPEPWHLSCRPLAEPYRAALTRDLLGDQIGATDIALKTVILNNLDTIYRRFVRV